MDISADNIQLGFLIGIYFLALTIIALTMIYFSRPRQRNPLPKTGKELSKPVDAPMKDNQLALPENNALQKPETVEKIEGFLNETGPLVDGKAPVAALKAVEETADPAVKKEDLDLNKTESLKEAPPEKTESTINAEALPVSSPDHPPLITITNAPKAQAESVAAKVEASPQKAAPEPLKGGDTKTEPKAYAAQVESSSTVANSNPDKTSSDFSELFTEDTEENETGRLAKELADIETDSLLETSQSLISQLKRKI